MTAKIIIRGLVQGVGFRPFIYKTANDMGLVGTVSNRNDGVVIHITTFNNELNAFIEQILAESPQVVSIHDIDIIILDKNIKYNDFAIISSSSESDEVTQVCPDILVCSDCLQDRKKQPHRINYPFINCTHCGPRFSIVKDLPYDRDKTTMCAFEMCAMCQKEYEDINDRRFHAQPIACNNCGPVYYTDFENKKYIDYNEIIELSSKLIDEGKIVAIRGIGGYHLVCDATNEIAVSRMREIKHRESKAFAVMCKDMETVKSYVHLNKEEEACLSSWRRPIVLLKQRKKLVSEINPKMKTLGCMLPYMPIHFDWFEHITTSVIVMTSGNVSDMPIAVTPEEAEKQLKSKVDLLIHHNRAIHNRVDDSVIHFCGTQQCIIRRSRGYAPEPFFTNISVEGILAFGAEKNNTFALGKGNSIIQSQYIGDLKNQETFDFYTESLERFQQLFRFTPKLLVCDLHPDYLSSHRAYKIGTENNVPLLKVQHHHAHAAACMLEYNLDEQVIAIVCDGIGLGDDGKAWGGEFLLCDRKKFSRISHFEYIPMPGGDKVSDEPWRMAVALLHYYQVSIPSYFKERVGEEKIGIIEKMIEKNINCPETSSVGRLFDAFASLLGICDIATRQAEAPILLEHAASDNYWEYYETNHAESTISVKPILEGVLNDYKRGVTIDLISAKIHNSFCHLLFNKAVHLANELGTNKIVLSGGCFQNKRLTEQLQKLFEESDLQLYVPSKIPCNDSGIAIGQMAIACARLNSNVKE